MDPIAAVPYRKDTPLPIVLSVGLSGKNGGTVERKLKLSPTSLQKWYESGCPARWDYDWQWKRKGVDEKFLEVGFQVHALMESGPDGWSEYPETEKFYQKMLSLLENSGIQLTGTPEQKFTWDVMDGVQWSIKIDAFGELADETPVIIDYKTAWGKGWKQTPSGMVPQTLAFQSPAYLMAPPGEVDWPKTIVYLVAPLWGQGQMFRVDHDARMEDNLRSSIEGAVAAMQYGGLPRIYGKHCLDCPFQPKCYGEAGEEELYVSRFEPKADDGHKGEVPGATE